MTACHVRPRTIAERECSAYSQAIPTVCAASWRAGSAGGRGDPNRTLKAGPVAWNRSSGQKETSTCKDEASRNTW